ncbi:Hypothetical protein ORPV_475 [Orpheovirus IHUMI-LCC2]|uniref:Uncharacterized protein n=1 Tax=Orpheovirus IHUMI-LCC2 TaxID=2023057 RepID=A0A2I2L4I8_9VIRU|nr:Hypothetical protein ORPV_475 [Orpheovirus IHUMI-LCC2]SNW62379.1 Hypothetical protein ORPV_475 [Orpheovirus IHUMI-LCC2]
MLKIFYDSSFELKNIYMSGTPESLTRAGRFTIADVDTFSEDYDLPNTVDISSISITSGNNSLPFSIKTNSSQMKFGTDVKIQTTEGVYDGKFISRNDGLTSMFIDDRIISFNNKDVITISYPFSRLYNNVINIQYDNKQDVNISYTFNDLYWYPIHHLYISTLTKIPTLTYRTYAIIVNNTDDNIYSDYTILTAGRNNETRNPSYIMKAQAMVAETASFSLPTNDAISATESSDIIQFYLEKQKIDINGNSRINIPINNDTPSVEYSHAMVIDLYDTPNINNTYIFVNPKTNVSGPVYVYRDSQYISKSYLKEQREGSKIYLSLGESSALRIDDYVYTRKNVIDKSPVEQDSESIHEKRLVEINVSGTIINAAGQDYKVILEHNLERGKETNVKLDNLEFLGYREGKIQFLLLTYGKFSLNFILSL